MKRVLTAVVLVPFVLLLVFRAPLWLFALAVAGIIVLALREYLNLAKAGGYKPFLRLTYVVALLPILGWTIKVLHAAALQQRLPGLIIGGDLLVKACSLTALLCPIIFGIPLVFRKDLSAGLASAASSAFGFLYVAVSLSLLAALRASSLTRVLVVFVLFSVWAGDIAAYYVGKNIGKHKLAPSVSPNKSWEGAIASVIASVGIAFLVFHFRSPLDSFFSGRPWLGGYWLFPGPVNGHFLRMQWLNVLMLGVLTNVAAQFGDLFESALKRCVGIKDSGTLLPGHGGVLDRIDALLFAIPVVWYYAQFNTSALVLWTFN